MNNYRGSERISQVVGTDDILSGRGGMTVFVRYLEKVGMYGLLQDAFGNLRRSEKGYKVWNLFKQVMCFFFDGTSRRLTYFDQLKANMGYAASIECRVEDMPSSHAVKRFFQSFDLGSARKFREIEHQLFLWRLRDEQPATVIMTLDTMVMDNDEAEHREGVTPTYKKKKGFQPLQLIWNGMIVDAIFRGGKKHGNHGRTAIRMIQENVELIRREYRSDVTIILLIDSGFHDVKNFRELDKMGIGFVAGGKMSRVIKETVGACAEGSWRQYENGRQVWEFVEFTYKCDCWDRSYRGIYTRPIYEGQQGLLSFERPENIILTNLGQCEEALQYCSEEDRTAYIMAETVVSLHHSRGADELPHRGLKDFGFEALPFKKFQANSAFYYCMVISFNLFEAFKRDVLSAILPTTCYATRVRRTVVDFAAKIVRSGRQILLKVNHAILKALQLDVLWMLADQAIPIRS